jgi:hypothetical protein
MLAALIGGTGVVISPSALFLREHQPHAHLLQGFRQPRDLRPGLGQLRVDPARPDPRLRRRQRVQRTCLATWRTRMIVVRSTPARSAACTVEYSPRNNPIQISYFSDGERNRLRRRPSLPACECPGSVIRDPFLVLPEASQMMRNQNADLCH